MRNVIRWTGPGTQLALDGPDADMLQELSILCLANGEVLEDTAPLERVYLLLRGRARMSHTGGAAEAARGSLFDEGPWALQAASGERLALTALEETELALVRTHNPRSFPARVWTPRDCRSEWRGEGTVGETATRIVRTIFDDRDAPWSNLVLGEVVTQPGRWSSYPPHHHPQPEIYHYRFQPSNGFGLAVVGREALTIRNGDTTLIRSGQVHPQAAAPGYAMWYLWSVRHLEGSRYGTPVYEPEHTWTARPDAAVWAPAGGAGGGR